MGYFQSGASQKQTNPLKYLLTIHVLINGKLSLVKKKETN